MMAEIFWFQVDTSEDDHTYTRAQTFSPHLFFFFLVLWSDIKIELHQKTLSRFLYDDNTFSIPNVWNIKTAPAHRNGSFLIGIPFMC